ncbi:hypothetical protein NL676_013497 [Syzygium grande]|nr:hypothetical protein NL676_013497 [Syzygium grande]
MAAPRLSLSHGFCMAYSSVSCFPTSAWRRLPPGLGCMNSGRRGGREGKRHPAEKARSDRGGYERLKRDEERVMGPLAYTP